MATGSERVHEEIVAAGFGGQGIMLFGKLVACAGMLEGRHVTYIPSYGAEVRGGTAHCMVVVSSEEIASPVVSTPATAVVMNHPSLVKFESRVRRGGLLVVNTSLVLHPASRTDIEVLNVPATEMADEMGNVQVANLVALGAYLTRRPVVGMESVGEALAKLLSAKRREMLALNERALRRGAEYCAALAR